MKKGFTQKLLPKAALILAMSMLMSSIAYASPVYIHVKTGADTVIQYKVALLTNPIVRARYVEDINKVYKNPADPNVGIAVLDDVRKDSFFQYTLVPKKDYESQRNDNPSLANNSFNATAAVDAAGKETTGKSMTDAIKELNGSPSENISVTGVSVTPVTASITVGGNVSLTANVTPGNAANKAVTWSSSNDSVATVNVSGVVTGVSAGTAVITVKTADGGKTAACTVTVTASASNVIVKDGYEVFVNTELADYNVITVTVTIYSDYLSRLIGVPTVDGKQTALLSGSANKYVCTLSASAYPGYEDSAFPSIIAGKTVADFNAPPSLPQLPASFINEAVSSVGYVKISGCGTAYITLNSELDQTKVVSVTCNGTALTWLGTKGYYTGDITSINSAGGNATIIVTYKDPAFEGGTGTDGNGVSRNYTIEIF